MSTFGVNVTCIDYALEKPLTWEECSEIVSSGALDKLARSAEQRGQYISGIAKLGEKYKTIVDAICIDKLKYPNEEDPETSKLRVIESQKPTTKIISFVPNDFPYYLDDNILHYLLWSNVSISGDEADAIITEKFPKAKFEYRKFCNPPALQSIPSVFHYHVFIRPQTSG